MRVLVMVSLLAATLAGCADAPVDDVEPETPVITDPNDFSYLNNTDGEGWHIHDYWGGKDRLDVIDQQGGTLNAVCTGCSGAMTITWAQPAEGNVIPQGAAWLELAFTITEDDPDGHGTPQVWIKTAADNEARFAGDLLPNGTFRFNSTNEDNDPPHQSLSLWEIELRVPPVGGEASFSGSVSVKGTAVRGLEVPAWPPHPDHWQGAAELLVADHDFSQTIAFRSETPGMGSSMYCIGGCPPRFGLGDGQVVPVETGEVQVVLTYAPGSMPVGITLSYHGADTRSMTELEGDMSTPGEIRYRIPTDQVKADSPYAKQSLWEFRIDMDDTAPASAWEGDLDVQVTAVHVDAL